MASPTTMIDMAPSSAASRQTFCPSKWCSVLRITVPPLKKLMKLTHWPPPCIIGAFTMPTSCDPSAGTRRPSSSGVVIGGWPKPPPPSAAKKMSSARHITPLGMPVVPPV